MCPQATYRLNYEVQHPNVKAVKKSVRGGKIQKSSEIELEPGLCVKDEIIKDKGTFVAIEDGLTVEDVRVSYRAFSHGE